MAVFRFVFRVDRSEWDARSRLPHDGLNIVPVDPDRDRTAVAALALACRESGNGPGGRFSPAGLAGELASRPGRRVHAWLVWPRGGRGVSDCPLGMVALVDSTPHSGGDARRFSISWLVVHPQSRRRGIAAALVRHAVKHAGALGGCEIFAETLSSWPAAVAFWQSLPHSQTAR